VSLGVGMPPLGCSAACPGSWLGGDRGGPFGSGPVPGLVRPLRRVGRRQRRVGEPFVLAVQALAVCRPPVTGLPDRTMPA